MIHCMAPNAYDLYHQLYHAGGLFDAKEVGVDVSAGGWRVGPPHATSPEHRMSHV